MGGFFRRKDVVGIELGESSLKLVHLKLGKINRVVELIDKNIGGFSDNDIASVIKRALTKLKKPTIIITIPSFLATTKNIEIPSVNPQEIEKIINLQANRYTPYSKEEVVMGYVAISTYRQSYTKILLIVVRRDIILRQIDILKKEGLKVEKILFAPEGFTYWHYFVLEPKESDFAILHIDFKFTDFVVVSAGRLAFVRTIPIGKKHLLKKGDYHFKFTQEVENSLQTYDNTNIANRPKKMVVSGALRGIENLEALLKGGLIPSLQLISYANSLKVPQKLEEIVNQRSFLSVIAPIIHQDISKVNLIPLKVKMERMLEERSKELIKIGIWVIIVFIFIWSTFLARIYTKSRYLRELEVQYRDLGEEVKKYEEALTKIRAVKTYLAFQGKSLEILEWLREILPPSIYLTNVVFEREDSFNIKGVSEAMAEVFSFVKTLEASPYFKSVKIKYTTKRREGDKDLADFEIISFLEK